MKDELALEMNKVIEVNEPRTSRKTAQAIREKRNKWYKVLSLITFFIIWEVFSRINIYEGWFNPVFLPSPTLIIETGYVYIQKGILFKHIGISLYRMLSGFMIGTIIAVIIGALIANFKWIENTMMPIINMFGPIPVLAFLPMFLIWFGIGENSKITLITYTTFISMLPYVTDGIKNTDPLLIRSAASLGASKLQVFTKVILNSAMPNIFTGMKACLGLGFSSLVVAEMMGASSGLGYIIVDAKNWFKMADMFLAAILIGILYTLFYGVLTIIESFLFKWKRDGISSAVEL
ncbi:ABC transporter permease [Clostridium polyendosporum]|uniref:ABC transporter permease n=1 Tax=Clostridium polyendosporum TaxID=69208 RepID=A0A919VHK5_9CLOT|nr:ABC transporter permease [Clostridium polyendosporum]GIM30347.1 ABC transporter permease [Clostridium polyendosporum]